VFHYDHRVFVGGVIAGELIASSDWVDGERWIVIDAFKLLRLPRMHVVTTDGRVGLTPKLADEALSKLGVKAVHSCEGDFDSDGVGSFI